MARTLRTQLLLLAALASALVASPAAGSSSQQEQVVGGVEEADADSQEVQQALDFAVSIYNQGNDDLYLSRVVRVISAQQQVAAGTNYYLEAELGQTTCTKSQTSLANCPFRETQDQQERAICSFQVYSRPWLNEMSVTNYSCQSA